LECGAYRRFGFFPHKKQSVGKAPHSQGRSPIVVSQGMYIALRK
jgi:hypothetical protein